MKTENSKDAEVKFEARVQQRDLQVPYRQQDMEVQGSALNGDGATHLRLSV